jgi:aerobic carbon-monoxide dehydrogenase small subunit
MLVTLNVNGMNKEVSVKPHAYLLDTLRDLGYMGVKEGCETGNCGVCTVLMDGKPVLSCSIPTGRAEGHKITTIEGVQAKATEIGSAIVSEGADQCGYCTPGLIMAVMGLENEISNPTEDDIRHYLTNNLCRCTGYAGHMRGIKKYLGVE